MRPFLSSNAQDFIEEPLAEQTVEKYRQFLSSNAQDFIEERYNDRQLQDTLLDS